MALWGLPKGTTIKIDEWYRGRRSKKREIAPIFCWPSAQKGPFSKNFKHIFDQLCTQSSFSALPRFLAKNMTKQPVWHLALLEFLIKIMWLLCWLCVDEIDPNWIFKWKPNLELFNLVSTVSALFKINFAVHWYFWLFFRVFFLFQPSGNYVTNKETTCTVGLLLFTHFLYTKKFAELCWDHKGVHFTTEWRAFYAWEHATPGSTFCCQISSC